MEYLVTMTTHVPGGTSGAAVDDVRGREAARSRELIAQGHLLRVWRTDEVTPLSPHPNDPGLAAAPDAEFLTTFVITVPEGTPDRDVREREAREAERAKELGGQGHLRRLWTLPGQGRALGLWQADGPAQMQAIVRSLPLDPWMTVETTPLSPHPSDPPIAADR